MSNPISDPKVTLIHSDEKFLPVRTVVQSGFILATLPGVSATVGCEREMLVDDDFLASGEIISHVVTLSTTVEDDVYESLPFPETNDNGLLAKTFSFNVAGTDGRKVEMRFNREITDEEYDEWLRAATADDEPSDDEILSDAIVQLIEDVLTRIKIARS